MDAHNQALKHNKASPERAGFVCVVRRRPSLPHGPPCSTIGAEGLSFRVRNGSGRFPFAVAAVTLWRSQTCGCSRLCLGSWTVDASHACGQVVGLLVPVSSTHCCASTSGLSTQSYAGSLSPSRAWKPHLETCFPLRCFQRLSLPNVANQRCPWQDN